MARSGRPGNLVRGGAELRLLPTLATHLTFPEIAGRLFISQTTVSAEALSIYRKLTASVAQRGD